MFQLKGSGPTYSGFWAREGVATLRGLRSAPIQACGGERRAQRCQDHVQQHHQGLLGPWGFPPDTEHLVGIPAQAFVFV